MLADSRHLVLVRNPPARLKLSTAGTCTAILAQKVSSEENVVRRRSTLPLRKLGLASSTRQLVLNLVATKTEMNGDDKPNVLGELCGVVRFQHVREVLLELENIFLCDGKFVLDARLDTFSFPFGENAVDHFVAASELFVSVDVERPTDDSQVSLQRSPC